MAQTSPARPSPRSPARSTTRRPAAASTPEKVIGQVTKLTGSATAIRNGVSITLNVGDNVHKGDVVQAGSDSSLGITFIDGTVFGLSVECADGAERDDLQPDRIEQLLVADAGPGHHLVRRRRHRQARRHEGRDADRHHGHSRHRGSGRDRLRYPAAGRRAAGVVPDSGRAERHDRRIRPARQADAAADRDGEPGRAPKPSSTARASSPSSRRPRFRPTRNSSSTRSSRSNLPTSIRNYIGIPPLDTITPQTFVVKLADGTPINQHSGNPHLRLVETPTGPACRRRQRSIPSQHSAGACRFRQPIYRTVADDRQYRAGHGVRHHPFRRHQSRRPSDGDGAVRFIRLSERAAGPSSRRR